MHLQDAYINNKLLDSVLLYKPGALEAGQEYSSCVNLKNQCLL